MVAVLFTLLVFFFFPTPVWAVATTNIVSSPNSITIDTPFDAQVSIQGDVNTSYYLKARIGINTSSLTKGLTNNSQNSPPDDWLTDNDSWLKFPIVLTDDSGAWQGSIHAKVSTSAILGNNLLVSRIRKVGTTDNINSSSKTLTITSTSSIPTPSPTPSPSPSPTATPTKTPARIATQSVAGGPTPTATPKKTVAPTSTPSPTPIATPSQSPTPESTRTEVSYRIASVAGATVIASVSATASSSATVEIKDQQQINPLIWIGLVFVFAGVGTLGYIYFKKNAKLHLWFRR